MNITSFMLGLVIALGYYFYTIRKERANAEGKAACVRQEQNNEDNLLSLKGGDK